MKKNESYTKQEKNLTTKKKAKSRHDLSGPINNNLNILKKKDVFSTQNNSSRQKDSRLIEKNNEAKGSKGNIKLQKSASPNKFFLEDTMNSEK